MLALCIGAFNRIHSIAERRSEHCSLALDFKIAELTKILKNDKRLGQAQAGPETFNSASAFVTPCNAESSGDRRLQSFRPYRSATLVDASSFVPSELV